MSEISGWHAHVYFNADTIDKAREICQRCSEKFGVEMGRVHEKPVGPHPDWSCQLAIAPGQFAEVVGWLTLNRSGLTLFIHPETGNALEDHRDRAMWMGDIRPLDISIFENA